MFPSFGKRRGAYNPPGTRFFPKNHGYDRHPNRPGATPGNYNPFFPTGGITRHEQLYYAKKITLVGGLMVAVAVFVVLVNVNCLSGQK
jgi:hypothetical protein